MNQIRTWLILLAAASLAACTAHAPIVASAPGVDTPTETIQAIRGLRTPGVVLFSAGQPGPEAWDALATQGVTTVINLRPDTEMAERDERTEVGDAGMAYHQIPIANADDLTAENAARLWSIIEAAAGQVMVHCASGQRAGALLALGAHQVGGMSPDAALAFGQSAGLTSVTLDAEVRARLGLPPVEVESE